MYDRIQYLREISQAALPASLDEAAARFITGTLLPVDGGGAIGF